MMVKEGDLVAIFHSIHRVMQAENLLKAQRADILLIPVPRQLTSDCGLAIRYPEAERSRVEAALVAAGLIPAEIYRRQGDDYLRLEAGNPGV